MNKKKALVIFYCIGEPCTHFLYGIAYQQQQKSRDSNRCLSGASFNGKFCSTNENTQGNGKLFRNIQNSGGWNYSALGSRQVPIYWLGSYVLIFLPSIPSIFWIKFLKETWRSPQGLRLYHISDPLSAIDIIMLHKIASISLIS